MIQGDLFRPINRDPFFIKGPALISFSGGRTSAEMLRRIVERHGGALPADVHVVFANVGMEREETLAFVDECSHQFGVGIVWLEYRTPTDSWTTKSGEVKYKPRFEVVEFTTASRHGEPFDQLIAFRKRLPNRQQRLCTSELKIRVMREFMKARGYEEWDVIMGLRADEPRRVQSQRKFNQTSKERWTVVMPLVEAGLGVEDIMRAWSASSFDLRLEPHEGNCTLCFLKTTDKRIRIMQTNPELAQWWIDHERRNVEVNGEPWSRTEPTYEQLAATARRSAALVVIDPSSEAIDCFCTD